MPARNPDLHGMAPDESDAALLLLDVINEFDFPDASKLLRHALPMADRLKELKRRCRERGIPAIYVNDNWGRWQSDWRPLLERCLAPDCLGREVAEKLQPAEDDYMVLKPKHSGFYSTALDLLLDYLEVKTLIITGLAGNICVLFTAHDAYMRDFNILAPADCCASNTVRENQYALAQIKKVLKGDIRPSTEMDLDRLVGRPTRRDSGRSELDRR